MPNRLKDSASPYLLQHAENPVDWYPWGEEAFEEARRRDVPIFLSVGYSSCHWCHVMAHESFEDEDVAEKLNEGFVPVKVDREERPDVDAVYMEATTALTGRGGWPMSVFLTPDGRPFVAGTYWPKEDRGDTPGFVTVLDAVQDAWGSKREDITASAGRIAAAIDERARTAAESEAEPAVADLAGPRALAQWDRRHGGFGQAPKFPQAMTLEWLLHRHLRTVDPDATGDPQEDENLAAVTTSLDAMARGGVHDQIGGGFHRYSTDPRWLVPHFEKMLYDNALLAPVCAQAAAVTGDARFDRIARSTCDYLLREMRHPSGGFYSATDADVEGEEGVFFVWTHEEFAEVVRSVGADVDRFAAFLGVSPSGNWIEEATREQQETNILHEPVDRATFCADRDIDRDDFEDDLRAVRSALYERREQRAHPGLDDKVLTSWNALAVRGLALTGAYLGLPEYIDAATGTAHFLHEELIVDGRLHHVWKDGQTAVGAFLEDVAYLAIACLDLYAVTGDPEWFERGQAHAEDALDRFRDPDGGGFFSTAHDAEELYTRPKDSWDNATPSGNSVMAEVATRLHGYTAETRWRDLTDEIVAGFQDGAERAPTGFGWFLRTCESLLAGPREIAIVGSPGSERDALIDELWRRPLPGTVIGVAEPDGGPAIPLLEGRGEVDGHPAAYVCRDHVCERPVTSPGELAELLDVPSGAL